MNEFQEIDPLGWRLSDSVVRGEIDNRERDRVTGRIWLLDRQFPIELTLRGNLLRDIAGCLVRFENPNPMPEDNEGFSPVQMGVTGMITASRKVRILDIATDELSSPAAGTGTAQDVKRVGNAVTIEWFSNANGRVTIQSTEFRLSLSDFSWRMTPEEEQRQIESNHQAYERWKDIVAEENDELDDEDFDDFEDDDDGWYMDEFEWERQFQESDAVTQRYMLLMETFLDHPDREQIIAHEMGWDWADGEWEAMMEAEEIWDDLDWEEEPPALEPNPATEGRDWVYAPDGKVRHPLSLRATDLARSIWRTCKELERAPRNAESEQQSLVFHAQTLSAKLTGALDSLAYDSQPDGGFIVACLKRALKAFESSAKSLGALAQQDALPPQTIQSFRDELLQIRQEILRLMQYYRQLHP